jgi:nucleosome binding factor SPN SPT16 subunit
MEHCSNISRTLIIEASPEQEKNYKFLLKLHEAALAEMRPGKPISGVYVKVMEMVAEEHPELVPHLTKNVGFGIGIEFKDAALPLNAKCHHKFRANTAFNLAIGFDGLKGPGGKVYALFVADTVLVREEAADVLTPMSKAWDDINFTFKEDDDDEGACLSLLRRCVCVCVCVVCVCVCVCVCVDGWAGVSGRVWVVELTLLPSDSLCTRSRSRAGAEDKAKDERLAKLLALQTGGRMRRTEEVKADDDSKRKNLQELTRAADEEAKARLLQHTDKALARAKRKGAAHVYKDRSLMAAEECRKLRIFFDKRNEAVILPIFGCVM